MTKYLLALVAALVLALGASGLLLKAQIKKNGAQAAQMQALTEAAERSAKQRKKDQALLARRAAENRAAALERASTQAALAAALAQNREWADQPVPQEVQDALKR